MMTFNFVALLCILSLAGAQMTMTQNATSTTVPTTVATTDRKTTTVASCGSRIRACQLRAESCKRTAVELEMQCACVKTEVDCLSALKSDCRVLDQALDEARYDCLVRACGTNCTLSPRSIDQECLKQAFPSSNSIKTNCPEELAACKSKFIDSRADDSDLNCNCFYEFWQCVKVARQCPDFETAFERQTSECEKLPKYCGACTFASADAAAQSVASVALAVMGVAMLMN